MSKGKLQNLLFLIITIGVSSSVLQSTALATTSEEDLDKIAKQCLPYLQQYGDAGKIPTKIAKQVSPILSVCISQASCQSPILSKIKNCAHKLALLSLSAQVENIKQQVSTQKKETDDNAESETKQSIELLPVITRTQPEIISTPTPQQPAPNTDKQEPSKKKVINWF